jgi:hypothetical protein
MRVGESLPGGVQSRLQAVARDVEPLFTLGNDCRGLQLADFVDRWVLRRIACFCAARLIGRGHSQSYASLK